jgi:uncharacterized protein YndB with AHSA1/START domain
VDVISVERSVWINAPRERVWQAVTNPSQLTIWWTGGVWTIPALEVGGEVRFGMADDVATAKIAVLDPPNVFRMDWEPNPLFPVAMTSELRLTEEDGGTRVTAIESGFEGLPEDIRAKRIEGNERGYEIVLAALKALLEGQA